MLITIQKNWIHSIPNNEVEVIKNLSFWAKSEG